MADVDVDDGSSVSSPNTPSGDLLDSLEQEYEIVEHEQAHAVAMSKASRGNEEEEEERLGQGATLQHGGKLSEPFLDQFAGMINHSNLESILREQEHMLSTMEISNEKLASLNNISESKFQAMSAEFRHHTQTLLTMKKQLDSCFRRIRLLKAKLATQYPEAYKVAMEQQQTEMQEDDDG